MRKTHYLKTWPEFFQAMKSGKKTFELRKNDRDYEVGDTLVLQEYEPIEGCYTGFELKREVTYLLAEIPFVPEGYVCMSVALEKGELA